MVELRQLFIPMLHLDEYDLSADLLLGDKKPVLRQCQERFARSQIPVFRKIVLANLRDKKSRYKSEVPGPGTDFIFDAFLPRFCDISAAQPPQAASRA